MPISATAQTTFLDENFLLENETARRLYFEYAAELPIIDYHNHLPPAEVAADRTFANCTRVWLNGDHYKWRAMRTHGIDEHYITGQASDAEKFQKWAETVPYTLRNPLYHWTHLELQRYFDVHERLDGRSGPDIYARVNERLNDGDHSVLGLLGKMRVESICTTDDPTDDLAHHQAHAGDNPSIKMYPAFRPDRAVMIESTEFIEYIRKLEAVSGVSIESYADLVAALRARIDFFHRNGCRLSDHGLNQLPFAISTESKINETLQKRLNGEFIDDPQERNAFKTRLLLDLCHEYHERGWVQQFHLGALRNNNRRMLAKLGPDTGWDSIGDFEQAEGLSYFLGALDSADRLTKTIIYNLNPRDNEVFATMIGNFNDGSVAGKVQWGSGWWFLDQLDGMEKQIEALSNMGLISHFVGMLTDSRSFLSFPRHEYFRRLLCNIFGRDVERGRLPRDLDWIGKIVGDISYRNAKEYFGMGA